MVRCGQRRIMRAVIRPGGELWRKGKGWPSREKLTQWNIWKRSECVSQAVRDLPFHRKNKDTPPPQPSGNTGTLWLWAFGIENPGLWWMPQAWGQSAWSAFGLPPQSQPGLLGDVGTKPASGEAYWGVTTIPPWLPPGRKPEPHKISDPSNLTHVALTDVSSLRKFSPSKYVHLHVHFKRTVQF